jgi:hypothetical protein
MTQPNVKELEALIKMLRKNGVTEFEGHGLKLRVDAPDVKPKNGTASEAPQGDDELSQEDLLFWSAGGN